MLPWHFELRKGTGFPQPVEPEVGNAPGWSKPGSRARRPRLQAVGRWDIDCCFEDDPGPVDLRAVQAVRPASALYTGGRGEAP